MISIITANDSKRGRDPWSQVIREKQFKFPVTRLSRKFPFVSIVSCASLAHDKYLLNGNCDETYLVVLNLS